MLLLECDRLWIITVAWNKLNHVNGFLWGITMVERFFYKSRIPRDQIAYLRYFFFFFSSCTKWPRWLCNYGPVYSNS